jgi:hypothetical protein
LEHEAGRDTLRRVADPDGLDLEIKGDPGTEPVREDPVDPAQETASEGLGRVATQSGLGQADEPKRFELKPGSERLEQTETLDGLELIAGPDLLERDTGPDVLERDTGPDLLERDTDQDLLERDAGPDLLERDTGPDLLERDTGPDVLERDTGPDLLERDTDQDSFGFESYPDGPEPDIIPDAPGLEAVPDGLAPDSGLRIDLDAPAVPDRPITDTWDAALSFIAVLELARTGFLRMYQDTELDATGPKLFLSNPDADDATELDYR